MYYKTYLVHNDHNEMNNTKDIILHVARKIFAQHGFSKTTIDGVARAAHKAKGSIYYHFKNKEELFQGVVEKEFQTLRSELIKGIDDGKNAKDKLTNYIIVRMKTISDLASFNEIVKSDYLDYLDFIGEIRKKYDNEEVVLIKSILTRGINNEEFELNNVEVTAPAILTALKGLELPFFMEDEHNKLDIRLKELVRLLIMGLEKR